MQILIVFINFGKITYICNEQNIKIMIKLLEFIKQNKFVLYKDGKWYSTKDFPAIFYDEIELIKLFNDSL
jgi:hypothetical protein